VQNAQKRSRIGPIVLALLGAALLLIPFFAAAEPATKEFRKEVAAKPGLVVVLENLAGAVTVDGTTGGPVEILATIHAGDARLLEELPIEVAESGARVEVTAKYPVERYDVYRYAGGEEGRTFFGRSSTKTTYLGRRVKVVSGGAGGTELWADFHLRLPAGTGAVVRNEVGRISASGVSGPLTATTGSGVVRIEGGEGETKARTGSGDVSVKGRKGSVEANTGSGDMAILDVTGPLSVETGSGDASIEEVIGEVSAHTGSGDVRLKRVEGERVKVRTGSGEIQLLGVKASLDVGSGSGNIGGDDLTVAGALTVETGSGDVCLGGDFGSLTEAKVGTSSGDVSFRLEKAPGMSLSCRTSSGDIDVDLAGTKVRSGRKLEVAVGGGGVPVKVHTSSGNIRLQGK
jgi:hypothetical protein